MMNYLNPFGEVAYEKYENADFKRAVHFVDKAEYVFFCTGAGMSVASGIPTFRGRFGLWRLWRKIFMAYVIFAVAVLILQFLRHAITFVLILSLLWFGFNLAVVLGILFEVVATSYGWTYCKPLAWLLFRQFFWNAVSKAKWNAGHGAMRKLMTTHKKKVCIHTMNVDELELELRPDYICLQHGRITKFVCGYTHAPTCIRTIPRGTQLPWYPIECEDHRCTMRTGCVLFGRDRTGLRELRAGTKPDITKDTKCVFIFIGTSNTISLKPEFPFWDHHVIEIDISATHRLNHDVYFENSPQKYVFLQGRSEVVLPKIVAALNKE